MSVDVFFCKTVTKCVACVLVWAKNREKGTLYFVIQIAYISVNKNVHSKFRER